MNEWYIRVSKKCVSDRVLCLLNIVTFRSRIRNYWMMFSHQVSLFVNLVYWYLFFSEQLC